MKKEVSMRSLIYLELKTKRFNLFMFVSHSKILSQ